MTTTFGGWLSQQTARHDWVGLLADQARRDPRFPRDGDPEQVRLHMLARGADSDAFEQLDDAEAEWLRAH